MICFVKTGRALLPEAEAYSLYLKNKGIDSIILSSENEANLLGASLYYRFGGFLNKKIRDGVPEIHEYNSISTGNIPLIKNLIKSIFACKPVCRSFLNKYVENEYFFSGNIPVFYRDMGADRSFFDVRKCSMKKCYDLAYFGSISSRKNLLSIVVQLADLGYKIVLGGPANIEDRCLLKKQSNIDYVGLCNHDEVKKYLARSKAGLNYIPDVYPLTHQTSTKVIEYLVAGLPIVSNQYFWIDEHSQKYKYKYLQLDDFFSDNFSISDSYRSDLQLPIEIAEQFAWDCILDKCGFDQIIIKAMGSV